MAEIAAALLYCHDAGDPRKARNARPGSRVHGSCSHNSNKMLSTWMQVSQLYAYGKLRKILLTVDDLIRFAEIYPKTYQWAGILGEGITILL